MRLPLGDSPADGGVRPTPPVGENFKEPHRNPAKRLWWGEEEGMEQVQSSPIRRGLFLLDQVYELMYQIATK